jgi:hypothetical protein
MTICDINVLHRIRDFIASPREPDNKAGRKIKPKLIVVGHAGSGKDTFCELLRDNHGYTFESSSWAALERVIWPSAQHLYPSKISCFNDRVNRRSEWFEAIVEYNREDPARLCREILERADIYCGMRSAIELQASLMLVDFVIWIDASERVLPEPKSSMTITREMASLHIDNNGSVEQLEKKAANLALALKMIHGE